MKNKISGGPERRAYDRENVYPVNFSVEDPFWDIPAILNGIDKGCKSGEIKDVIIIQRKKGHIKTTWRGKSPMTTALGMLEYSKELLYRGSNE